MLGFAPSSNEYKVLVYNFGFGVKSSEVELGVYSLKDQQWKIKPDRTNVLRWYSSFKYGTQRVFCIGTLYWFGYD